MAETATQIEPARRPLLKDLNYRIQHGLFVGLMRLFRGLGLERASRFGGWFARSLGPLIPISNRARTNLRLCFPDKSEDEIEKIVRGMWDNLGRTFAEYPHLDKFDAYNGSGRISVSGTETLDEIISRGTGAIFVSGHFANWELLPLAASGAGLSGGEVYRAANNPYVDNWLVGQRTTHVYQDQIPKGSHGARKLLAVLKDKRYVVMLIDQKMNDGISVPLFGQEAMTPPAAAQLSLRYKVPIVPASIERKNDGHFHIHVFPELEVPQSGRKSTDIYALTLKLNEWLEERIRERPEQWLWLHRRWPKD